MIICIYCCFIDKNNNFMIKKEYNIGYLLGSIQWRSQGEGNVAFAPPSQNCYTLDRCFSTFLSSRDTNLVKKRLAAHLSVK